MRLLARCLTRVAGCRPVRISVPQRRSSTSTSSTSSSRLNGEIEYASIPLLAHSATAALANDELGGLKCPTRRMNVCQAVNDALALALAEDERVLVFGEDVAFGGVFRCTVRLADTYGAERVFNTPLTEQGIAGFAIGAAADGMRPVAEIQFADYIFPAFDQLVNEAAKFRYRDGAGGRAAAMTLRMPCGAIGHGALYHSQSPESLFTHVPGLRVVMPRSPIQAKGLLLASIRSNDPCLFFEPKALYRAASEEVPTDAYELPLSMAEVLRPGADVTVVSYGQPLYKCWAAIDAIERDMAGATVELVDLRTIYPWDRDTVLGSVRKTGRCVVVHESMVGLIL